MHARFWWENLKVQSLLGRPTFGTGALKWFLNRMAGHGLN